MKAFTFIGIALCLALPAQADIYVVVASSSPLQALTTKELQAFYMGRNRTLASGDPALVYDLPREDALRDAFYLDLTGMRPAQVNSYWSRLIFTGQVLPPTALPNERSMVDTVRRNPGAIGYLGKAPTDSGLRTVLVLKTPDS